MSTAKPGSVARHFSTCLPFPLHPSAPPASRAGAGIARRRKHRGEERKKQNSYRWQGYYCPGRVDG
ncbi:hypothetical protein [Herbaspirillum robiniae]|uniref:Uncharacterized protein n=1 Tax=Herbaspirillum robiniae TaxID=2014887 RepID=A0A246WNP1_9BURK|nr:hypothetical protein [Herbaspirillum robiniae]NUU02345.1 hypothetical protein [Herbaspirillum robiniae]OWY27592.1 hypothetical protein CEJ42_18705 [Herbaspirillum robiniae]